MVQLLGMTDTDPTRLPDTVVKAGKLMLAGAALAVVQGALTALADLHRPVVAGSNLASGVFAAAVWWWVAKSCVEGRSGARVLATVFFVVSSLGTASMIGGNYHLLTAALAVLDVISWLVGLAVVVLLWQRASSGFFESRRPYPHTR